MLIAWIHFRTDREGLNENYWKVYFFKFIKSRIFVSFLFCLAFHFPVHGLYCQDLFVENKATEMFDSSILVNPEEINFRLDKLFKNFNRVFFPIAHGASNVLLSSIIEMARGGKKFEIIITINNLSPKLLRMAVETGNISVKSLFVGPNQRELYREGLIDYVPNYLSDLPRLVDNENFKIDYIALRGRLDKGMISFGGNNDHIFSVLQHYSAVKILAEIDNSLPKLKNRLELPASQFDLLFFRINKSIRREGRPSYSHADLKISEYIADLIPDSATLQVGVGEIFLPLGAAIVESGPKNLKIWSEMIGEGLIEIIESSLVISVSAGFVFGGERLNAFIDDNSKIQLRSTKEINDIKTIIETQKFHAINTAIQVDLYGQVNATMGPSGRISSPGGQVEFMMGASRSNEGKAIIALRSIDNKTGKSKIVLDDFYRGPVTTPAEMVTHVVTEFGIASLRGATEAERALQLINIASPLYRRRLFQEAMQRGLLRSHHNEQINWEGSQ